MKFWRSLLATLMLLGVPIVPINFILPVNAQQGQTTLNPTDDVYTDGLDYDINYGGRTYLMVTLNTNGRFVWLKFDLSEVPDGAIVTSATLELHCWLVSETFNVSAHFCSNNTWMELTITESNQPEYNKTAMSWMLIGSPDQWCSWDVAYAINKTIDGIYGGEDMVTIVLQENWDVHEGTDAYFYSKEYGSYIPKLTIAWSGIIAEFPSFLIMPLFIIATLLPVIVYRIKQL